jgi:precorrin-6B methylase 2
MSDYESERLKDPSWERLLQAAKSDTPNVYSASFFARKDISIIDQQFRAYKLCYLLSRKGEISSRKHIAVVGAGFAGMTCAVALAMCANCTVSVFDREKILLKNFRQAGFRYIHPDLNSRGGWGNAYEDEDTRDTTHYPFMNWSAAFAPSVADQVVSRFNHYRRLLNIALHLEEEVCSIEEQNGKVVLSISSKKRCVGRPRNFSRHGDYRYGVW